MHWKSAPSVTTVVPVSVITSVVTYQYTSDFPMIWEFSRDKEDEQPFVRPQFKSIKIHQQVLKILKYA
jgi:hypothetical protein